MHLMGNSYAKLSNIQTNVPKLKQVGRLTLAVVYIGGETSRVEHAKDL